MKLGYRIAAEAIFIIHSVLFLTILFGWLWPSLWPFYITLLVLTLFSDLLFGYCVVSKWEFDLRKRLNPHINYDYSWSTFYTYKLTNKRISDEFLNRAAVIFLVLSILINLSFYFLF